MSILNFPKETLIKVGQYEALYKDAVNKKIFIEHLKRVQEEHVLLQDMAIKSFLDQLPAFKNFFHSSLDAQNDMLRKAFGPGSSSDNFIQGTMQTSIPAPYLTIISGLINSSVHQAYTAICTKFFGISDSDDEEFNAFGSYPYDDDPFLVSNKDNQANSSSSAHQSSPLIHPITEDILNAPDHMIVDNPKDKQKG
jgi:hypothetical protein